MAVCTTVVLPLYIRLGCLKVRNLLVWAVCHPPLLSTRSHICKAPPNSTRTHPTQHVCTFVPISCAGRFVSSRDVAPGVRVVVIEAEVSRERVPLRNAYKSAGQRACVRINSGVEHELTGVGGGVNEFWA